MLTNYIFLLLGFGYALFLPGFVFTEAFYYKLPGIQKIQLYFLLSVILSSFLSYFLGTIFGFRRLTLVLGLTIVLIFLMLLTLFRKFALLRVKKHLLALGVGVVIYLLFLISLYPAIFIPLNDHFVMGGPNWQDTAMHLSIIETIAQGNFPPQSPYFSGAPLSYYYFADFHSAIINTFFGEFFPRVLVYINPFFAFLFFLSVYNLSFYLSKNKRLSLVTAFIAVFFGNLGFIDFIKDVLNSGNALILLARDGYGYEYNKLLQMVPVSNYFLQNRPMMYGLPALATVILLLFKFLDKKNYRLVFLMGIIIASFYKFQLFGLIVSIMVIFVSVLVYFFTKKIKLHEIFKFVLICFSPFIFLYLVFPSPHIGDRNVIQVFTQTFKMGAWQEHTFEWYLKFIFLNFGLTFIFAIFSIAKKQIVRNLNLIICYIMTAILFSFPFLIKFTIYDGDMFKFFYYMVIFASILAVLFVAKLSKLVMLPLIVVLVLTTTSTSMLTLAWSYLNKGTAYSQEEYQAGIWIRKNTNSKSVFIEMPTVHSPVSDIGGRLRVISYITWPYSHGFNVGADNVFSRKDDMEYVYKTGDFYIAARKYNANYIYYGKEEKSRYPSVFLNFDRDLGLKKIYNSGGISIYEII